MEFYPRTSGACSWTEFLTLSKVQREPTVSQKCSGSNVCGLVSDSTCCASALMLKVGALTDGLDKSREENLSLGGKPPNEKWRTMFSIQGD